VHKELSAAYTAVETTISDVLKELRLRKPDPLKECPKCGSRNIKLVKERTSTYESTGTFTRTIKHYSEDGTETGPLLSG
jgi:DNA-directed RNA polymerase subunit RPC12/RpoP